MTASDLSAQPAPLFIFRGRSARCLSSCSRSKGETAHISYTDTELLMFRGDTVLLGGCYLWCNAGVFSLLEPESRCKWKRCHIQAVLLRDKYHARIILVHR